MGALGNKITLVAAGTFGFSTLIRRAIAFRMFNECPVFALISLRRRAGLRQWVAYLGKIETNSRLVGAQRGGRIADGGQPHVAVRPNEVEGISGDAGLAGCLAPGKPLQPQSGQRACAFDIRMCLAIRSG